MEEKLIIDKELFEELKQMISSKSEDDVVTAIGIIESFDEWDKQNQQYKEQLYDLFNENRSIKDRHRLLMKVWLP
jgi:hypothetical protein